MIHFRPAFAAALIVAAAFVSVTSIAADITLRADTWCPYNCEPGSKNPGYIVEIAKAALEPANTVKYETLNWARAIADTRDGKFAGIVGAAKSDAPDFKYPDHSLGLSSNCFFVNPDSKWTYKDISSLAAFPVGIIKDYTYNDLIDKYVKENASNPKKLDIVAGDNPLELNLKKLKAGRIGAFIEDSSVVKNYMFSKNLSNQVKDAGCVKETEIYIGFGPKDPKAVEYAKLVSDKVAAMRKDGSLKKLLARYGIDDWKK